MMYISEIFDEFENAKLKEDKIAVLKKYLNNPAFYNILKGTFHPDIKFVKLPKKFEYHKSDLPYGNTDTTLAYENKFLWKFLESTDLDINIKLQKLLIILESLHVDEAEVLLGMINKKLKIKGLTKALIKEIFPEFFPLKK